MLANGGPFNSVTIGAWSVATKAGAIDADPYTRASLERSGDIPLALGEGLQLIARADDSARALVRRCSGGRRGADAQVSIYGSASAHAGNWLPVGAPGRFALVLRLYGSPMSA